MMCSMDVNVYDDVLHFNWYMRHNEYSNIVNMHFSIDVRLWRESCLNHSFSNQDLEQSVDLSDGTGCGKYKYICGEIRKNNPNPDFALVERTPDAPRGCAKVTCKGELTQVAHHVLCNWDDIHVIHTLKGKHALHLSHRNIWQFENNQHQQLHNSPKIQRNCSQSIGYCYDGLIL